MVISVVGKNLDGSVFEEDSRSSTYPASLNSGLEEGTQWMSPGARFIFYLPWHLALGEEGTRQVAPYSAVIYEVEMLSMTRDHNYYDEPEDAPVDMENRNTGSIYPVEDFEEPEDDYREAGDYVAVCLRSKDLGITVEGYSRQDIVRSYVVEGFQLVVTGDRTIVLDDTGREVFRNTLDEENNSYNCYYLTAFRDTQTDGPVFLVLDMGFNYGSFFGSMVYKIENGTFSQVPEFLNLVTFNRADDDEHYGCLSPVLDIYREKGKTSFHFNTALLSYNPAGTEILIPGEDFVYLYDGEKLEETGAATGLTYFRIRNLTRQFQQTHDYRIYHAEIGDVDDDGEEELVIFVYENETIYVCQLAGDRVGAISGYDLPYDYTIDRDRKVLRHGILTVERDMDHVQKKLAVRHGNLIEVE
ncbi:MAG: FKBP-type peptidyl-prolyl cis-trans isomerase, partial [Rikenellaceae bacterium]|nr:FKBP-type peptidyl-prolyl cis-trans isomerase [Rikenellaceae bacterium]